MDHGASSYRRYLRSEEEAFAEIVKEYFNHLVFFLQRYVSDVATAEDIAMDVFAWVVANKKRYNFSVSLKTYLFMLGRSRALDYIKHRNKLLTVELSQAEELADQAPSPDARLLQDRRRKAIHKTPETLGGDMRSSRFQFLLPTSKYL